MGVANAKLAARIWGPTLPPTPRLVLNVMALITLDADQRPSYWAGWELLVEEGLGRELPPEPDDQDTSKSALQARAKRHAAKVALADAIAVLRRKGAISTRRAGGRGRNAEYWLNLRPQGQASPGPGVQEIPGPEVQEIPGPEVQEIPGPEVQASPGPEEDRGGLRSTERKTSPQVGTSPAPRRPSSGEVRLIDGGLRALVDLHRAGVGS